jgi:outer membrane protein TolC
MIQLLFAIALAAPLPETGTVSEHTLVAHALQHHPRVAAAEGRVRAAEHGVDAAGWWPQPTLGLAVNPLPLETRNGPAWGTVKLGQALPWATELGARTDGAQQRVRVAQAQVAEARVAVALGVRRAVAALALVEAQQAINGRTLALVRRLVGLAQARLAVDSGGQIDVLEAQVALAQLENVGLDLVQRRALRQVALNTALGRVPRAALPAIAPGVPTAESVDALLDRARVTHPALDRLAATVAGHRARARVAAAQDLPRFTVGVGYTVIGAPEMAAPGGDPGRDALHFEGGLTLPLWSGADAAEASAEAAAAATRAARDDLEQQIVLRVIAQHTQVETALRAVQLYAHTVLPLAQQRLEVLEAAYAVDRARFTTLIEAQRALERFETEHARAQAAAAIAVADLYAAVGEETR